MFKVGDKVVRKEGCRGEVWCMRTNTPSAPFPVLGQKDRYLKVLPSDEIPNWDESYFDLYVEPAAVPKFKVGDKVHIPGNKAIPPSTIRDIKFVYTFLEHANVIHEAKLSLYIGPPKPREVIVDGVIYREVT